MPTERPILKLIQGDGHTTEPAETSRRRITAALAGLAEDDLTEFDDILYGDGGGPPPPPKREAVKVGERPASFRVVP